MGQLAQERWINPLSVDTYSRQEVCTWSGLRAPPMPHYIYLGFHFHPHRTHAYTRTGLRTHTHTDMLGPGPIPDCIWLVIVSGQLGSSGAPAALMEQSRQASLRITRPSQPLFTPSRDKFNLEVQRTDKTRRQHKGQRGRGVIWYLLLPPVTSETHTHTHTHTHIFSSPFPAPCNPTPSTPCIPRQRHLFFSFYPFIFFSLIRWMTEEKRWGWATPCFWSQIHYLWNSLCVEW